MQTGPRTNTGGAACSARGIKAKLVLLRERPNESTCADAVERYIEQVMAGTEPVATLQESVERTLNIELMRRFAMLMPGADVVHIQRIIATAQVMEN